MSIVHVCMPVNTVWVTSKKVMTLDNQQQMVKEFWLKATLFVVPLLRTERSLSLNAIINDGMIPFAAYTTTETSNAFSIARTTPKIALPVEGSRPHLIHGSVGPCASRSGWLIGFNTIQVTFCKAHGREQQRPHYSVCSNRPHLAIAAVWPKIITVPRMKVQCATRHQVQYSIHRILATYENNLTCTDHYAALQQTIHFAWQYINDIWMQQKISIHSANTIECHQR